MDSHRGWSVNEEERIDVHNYKIISGVDERCWISGRIAVIAVKRRRRAALARLN